MDEFVRTRVLPEHREVVARLRDLMEKYAPGAKEQIGYGIPVWRTNRNIVVLSPTKKDITFSFAHGASFTDRYGLLQGVGGKSKHVKLKSVSDIDEAALRDYLEQELGQP